MSHKQQWAGDCSPAHCLGPHPRARECGRLTRPHRRVVGYGDANSITYQNQR